MNVKLHKSLLYLIPQWQRLNRYNHKKLHTFDDFPQLMISRALQNTLNIFIYHSKLMMPEYFTGYSEF